MNRIQKITALAVMLAFVIASVSVDAEERIEFSGHVVDMEGNPIPGFTFVVEPMVVADGMLRTRMSFNPFIAPLKTDSEGAFTAKAIPRGLMRLNVMPEAFKDIDFNFSIFSLFSPKDEPPPEVMHRLNEGPDKTIYSMQIGQVTYFNTSRFPGDPESGLIFGLKQGTALEDIKITVKSRLKIRARVVYADGTPLANAEADFSMEQRHEFRPNHSSSSSSNIFTDADGYFSEYPDEPGFYTISVEYNGLSAGKGPFLLKEGAQPEEIVLTLDGNAAALEGLVDEGQEFGEPAAPAAGAIPFGRQNRSFPDGVWIINPANGHAYKRIRCEGWHDAQRKAIAEGAHLVSINDEAEQHWLDVIFHQKPFWIGLTDAVEEGEWQWDSGEPVTYENWAIRPAFGDRHPEAEKDYVAFTFRQGRWESAGPESRLWQMTRQAIIEKDGLVSTVIPEEPPE